MFEVQPLIGTILKTVPKASVLMLLVCGKSFPSAEESADRGEFLSQTSSALVKTYSETELEKAAAGGVDLSFYAFDEMLLITKIKANI